MEPLTDPGYPLPEVTLLIPTYNGAERLHRLLPQIESALPAAGLKGTELLIIDDGSRDTTWQALPAMALRSSFGFFRGIRLAENRGQQAAVLAGLGAARGKRIITMDDDGAHPPALIPALLQKEAEGCELVYAVPAGRGRPLHRRMGTAAHDLFFRFTYPQTKGIRITSFRLFTRGLAQKTAAARPAFIYISALALRENPVLGSVAYQSSAASGTKSRYSIRRLARLFLGLLVHYGPHRKHSAPAGGPPFTIAEERSFKP